MRTRFGSGRRTLLAGAPAANGAAAAAFSMPGQPATVLVSEMGWVRVLKGRIGAAPRYKEGDREAWRLAVETSDRLLLFAASGRVFTIAVDRLPDGRGMGRPLRLHADMAQEDRIVSIRAARPDGRLLLAAGDGRGFIVREADAARPDAGRQAGDGRRRAAGGCGNPRAGRFHRRDRREPAAPGLPARRGAGTGARARRPPAAL